MIKHLFKLAKKNLWKNKYYTFINVFGLTCGMLAVLIIAKYVGYYLQFDHFHQNKDRIYVVSQEESLDGNTPKKGNATYWGVGELMKESPGVLDVTRYHQHVEALIIAKDDDGKSISLVENKIFIADSSFLNIFTFPLIQGDPKTALSKVNAMILTESAAKKYFGDANPIGKTLTIRVSWGRERLYEVTGVMEDIPQPSRFKFEYLITPASTLSSDQAWEIPAYNTYALLKEKTSAKELAKKLTTNLQAIAPLQSDNKEVVLSMESLASGQLSSTNYLLAAVGLFIVLICWINYINQVIAQSYGRVKEVGMLRVLGASRIELRTQFILESTLICLFSLTLIIGLYVSLEQPLQSLTNAHLLPLWEDPTPINFFFLAIFMVGIIITAIIPTFILFSPKFVKTLRNAYSTKVAGVNLRKALVIVQFSISAVLLIGIFVIKSQLEYLKTKDKGINMESVLVVKAALAKNTNWAEKNRKLKLFKDQCAELPFVTEVASSTTVPSEEYRNETFLSIKGKTDRLMVHQNGVDDQFFQLYDADFIGGRDFLPKAKFKNKNSIVLNESAAKGLGITDFENIEGTKIMDEESDEEYDLIGIVKDYHKTALKYELAPIAFKFNKTRGHVSMKINSTGMSENELEQQVSAIEQIWTPIYSDAFFDHFFLEKRYERQNLEDRYFEKLFSYFTLLSIILSCIGLFGMSLLISTKRQKEVGVRKVFGASTIDILVVFLRSYLGVLILPVVLGSLMGFWLMDRWLRDYAFRINIGIGLISIAVISLVLIFVFTISYHTIKSALANPVTVLKD
ncbi:MAG: ABC transporter permease [Bacteroidota bacterium]